VTNPIPTPISDRPADSRTRANRANALLSTGPCTAAGKQRSSQNALSHGLPKPTDPDGTSPGTEIQERRKGVPATSRSAVLATEDPANYQRHCRQFFDEYQPATPTEIHLTQELADTAWRLNRIPILEADLLSHHPNPQTLIPQLATLGMHSQRLSRQFQKTLDMLREIQEERQREQERQLKRAAALLELHKHKGIPYDPAEDGFVFAKDQVEAFVHRLILLNERTARDVLAG
jgi:hypothetical protein